MKTIKVAFYALVGVVAVGALIYITLFATRGVLNVTLSSDSTVKNGVHFWLSADNFKKEYSVPKKVRLPNGTFVISALGENSAEQRETVTIARGKQTDFAIKLDKNPQDNLVGTSDATSTIPYYSLFPYDGGDYQITAELNSESTAISTLVITVYHQIPENRPDTFIQERDMIVTAAKKWLADHGVPAEIPTQTVDQ